MAIFRWSGKTRQGQEQSGELDVGNKDLATAMLRRQGFVDIKVKKKPIEIEILPEKVTEKDISVFFRQLATMLNAGLPLVQGFELAEKGAEKKSLIKLLKGVREELEGGSPLAETMRKFPKEFDRLTCALVEAGEQGGILDTILLRLCTYKEKALSLKAKIKSAMIYPISIVTVAFIVTAILLIFVIPSFEEIFSSFTNKKGEPMPLPLMTQITINIAKTAAEYWYLVIGIPILLVVGITYLYKTEKGRYQLDKLMLNLPVLGDVLRKAAVARFCRTFATLTGAGVPILDALDTVSETAGNEVVREVILESKESIRQGQTLTAPLEQSGVFPVMVTQMISIGEQIGALEDMLSKIADFYEEEVDTAVDNMTALMEPAILAFLGVVVGGLVISMYLPIFNLADMVGP